MTGRSRTAALAHLDFSAAELAEIDRHAVQGQINLWAPSSDA
jgi:L-glyceraldehyde 3-phosphate reductase